MFSPAEYETKYTLNFPPQPTSRGLFDEARAILAKRPIRPLQYEVEVKFVSANDMNESHGRNVVLSSGVSFDEFFSQCFGYSLVVSAEDSRIFHRKMVSRNLVINALFHRSTGAHHLVNLFSEIRLGGKRFSLDYITQGDEHATLERVTHLKHWVGRVYYFGDSLTNEQAGKLHLNSGGLSEPVDWIKTFRRFATQTEPDSYGNFHNGRSLTAEDVYRRLFIPAIPA